MGSPITKCKVGRLILIGNGRRTHVAPTVVSANPKFGSRHFLPSIAGIFVWLALGAAYVARISTRQ